MPDPLDPVVAALAEGRDAVIVCGPFGGGTQLVAHLEDRVGHAQVRDEVAGTGLGPLPRAASPADASGTPVVRLVRDRPHGAPATLDLLDAGVAAAVVTSMIDGAISAEQRRLVADTLGAATALLDDLPTEIVTRGSASDLAEAALRLDPARVAAEDMERRGGRRLYALGRLLCICSPPALAPTSEWPQLARELHGDDLGPSDLAIVLSDFPGLFARAGGLADTFSPAGPIAHALLLGAVAPSAEEHRQLLEALRRVARNAAPGLPSASVRHHLPEQALLAGTPGRLVSDPTAVLASDPHALAHALERSDAALRDPVAHATLLSVHHLQQPQDAAAHLELAMRRRGLRRMADMVRAAPAERRWHPVWARSRPASVHRVLVERSVGALCVDAIADGDELLTFAGYADGSAWRASDRAPAQAMTPRAGRELRAVACAQLDGELFVAYGTSNHEVVVFDGRSLAVRWTDGDVHKQPLSAIAAAAVGKRMVVVSAGVEGKVVVHDGLAGVQSRRGLVDESSEVRGLALRVERDRTLLATACVDGTASVVDLATGDRLQTRQFGHSVLNAIAFADGGEDDDGLAIVVAASDGTVLRAALAGESEPETVVVHASRSGRAPVSANGVRALATGEVISAGSGGTVSVSERDATGGWVSRPLVGHVAPAWSVAQALVAGRQHLVSAGADGAVRLWPPAALAAEASLVEADRDEGVDVVAFGRDADGTPLLLAGDALGVVRAARLTAGDGNVLGAAVCHHRDRVSALVAMGGADEATRLLASGAVDGTLRLTTLGAEPHRSRVLGIVHGGITALAAGGQHDGPRSLVSGGIDGFVVAWDLRRGIAVASAPLCDFGAVTTLAGFDVGAETLVIAGGQDGRIRLLRCPSLECLVDEPVDATITAVCAVHDDELHALALATADGQLATFRVSRDLRRLEPIIRKRVFNNEILGLASTRIAGRSWIAACGLDRHLRIVDPRTGAVAMEVATDGYGRSIAARDASIAVGTSLGATVIEISPEGL